MELTNHQDRELVLRRLANEGAVVNAEMSGIIGLPHQEDRGKECRCAQPNDALGEHGIALALKLVLLELWVAVGPNQALRGP
jgi:hypothetical protein